ncbi:MAG: molybdopterin-dependent oxidoreductase [Rubrivivax sp.]|nr:molybdopterin-dependent oxidoreductase [Rubrivivax sp.]
MVSRFTRRRFLQITGSALGASAAGTAVWSLGAAGTAGAATPGEVKTIPTFCEMCFWRCGGIAHVRDGRLWKFEGNPLDPQSRGRLCPRGTGAVGAHHDPDRLRQPLLRVGERGKEQWKPVSWDEALAFVAERMNRIKAEHGPESVALLNHGFGQRFFQHVLKSWGAVNIAGASYAQCRGARDAGFALTFGNGVGSPEPTDIRHTRCLVLIGSHLGENMHNSQVQEFAEAVGRGVPVIVVDPRYSVAASKAKYWLPVKPGTDLALLLAWANLLVTEGRYDREFVAAHGHGFDKFVQAIRHATPEWAAAQCDVSADLIRAAAREFAAHRPATIVHPGRRVNWYGDDTQRSRAVALLNALLGSYGRAGGLYIAQSMKVPPVALPPYPKSTRPRADGSDGAEFPFADEGITTSIRKATLTGQPYPVKGWFVYSSNLMQALPDERETIEAIQKLDLLVVCDTVPGEMAGWADVVLPDTTFLERHDELLVGYGRTGWAALRQPVVAPPHDQKPAWWIAKQLAGKLGVAACMPFDDLESYLRQRVTAAGLDWERLKKDGVVMGQHQPVTVEEGLQLSFDTPSGKVEFWSDQLAAKGFDAVPKYTPPAPAPAGHFRLITGRSPVHTFSRTQTNPLLHDLMPDNDVWVHPDTAAGLGLAHRDWVTLTNQDGITSNRVRLRVTQRIRPDTLYTVYGFGHKAPALKRAHGRGASAAALNTRYATDPIMGATSIHTNFVKLNKA